MASTGVKRVTLSFPSKVVSDLDFISSALGVSRSALVSGLLTDILPPLIPLANIVKKDLTDGDSRRYRGEFKEEMQTILERLNGELQDDLFKK
jgi:hypothetical protein